MSQLLVLDRTPTHSPVYVFIVRTLYTCLALTNLSLFSILKLVRVLNMLQGSLIDLPPSSHKRHTWVSECYCPEPATLPSAPQIIPHRENLIHLRNSTPQYLACGDSPQLFTHIPLISCTADHSLLLVLESYYDISVISEVLENSPLVFLMALDVTLRTRDPDLPQCSPLLCLGAGSDKHTPCILSIGPGSSIIRKIHTSTYCSVSHLEVLIACHEGIGT
jgi:hypothetical protein